MKEPPAYFPRQIKWDRPLGAINWPFLIVLTVAAFATRWYRISNPNFVLWDEAHFGKFGSYYLRRMFYFDVHPPLGKMLVGLAGWLAGVEKSFEFGSGETYPEGFDYVRMRLFVSIFGTLAVPLSYLTAHQLRLSSTVSMLCGLMALLDNGLIGITRLILLDSFLLGFTALTAFAYACFRNQEGRPFSLAWWAAMFLTGVGIGLASSVKWVGLFVTALVGLNTIEELWSMVGDTKMSRALLGKHFFARCVGLIVIPLAIYAASFVAHFTILNRSGPGDANMSSLFQASLEGNELQKSPPMVAWGGQVTLKSRSYGGGLLHSHVQTFPSGSRQQQVTTYHHRDANNDWIMVKSFEQPDWQQVSEVPEPIKDGDIVRLRHQATGRFLHSHAIAAPLTSGEWEVSAYGSDEYQDPNDLWRIEFTDKRQPHLGSLGTRFRLRHVQLGCLLKARNKQLPDWGFKQGEVTCDPKGKDVTSNANHHLWNIESNVDQRQPAGTGSNYRSSFWDNLKDCNVGMYLTNNALTPDPELEPGILTSKAIDWFWMRKGIRMSGWADDRPKFYMLGNPSVWWTGSAAILTLIGLCMAFTLIRQRGAVEWLPQGFTAFQWRCKLALGGWALTYLPFFIMGRVLYLHHYYPALLFAILSFGVLLDLTITSLSPNRQRLICLAIGLLVAANFYYFAPMAYGIEGPATAFAGRHWMSSWNLVFS